MVVVVLQTCSCSCISNKGSVRGCFQSKTIAFRKGHSVACYVHLLAPLTPLTRSAGLRYATLTLLACSIHSGSLTHFAHSLVGRLTGMNAFFVFSRNTPEVSSLMTSGAFSCRTPTPLPPLRQRSTTPLVKGSSFFPAIMSDSKCLWMMLYGFFHYGAMVCLVGFLPPLLNESLLPINNALEVKKIISTGLSHLEISPV